MPELPEVEVVRRGLERHLTGGVVTAVELLHPRAVRGQEGGGAALVDALEGARIASVSRRGKFLWLTLADGSRPVTAHVEGDDAALAPAVDAAPGPSDATRHLVVHLGMSGQMLVGPPGRVRSPHARIRTRLVVPGPGPDAPVGPGPDSTAGHETELTFVDQRTFGRWEVVTGDPVPHIARDPLDPELDVAALARRIRTRRSEIKRVLLDQTVVSGIGNIYADEALWAARVMPFRRASSMRQRDVVTLLGEAKVVMERALAAGGTSFDALYVDVEGASGYFARSLAVYGREGLPCPRCGTPVTRIPWAGRSTHLCRTCQVL
ncbi:bifunctional DNA-formamidopyrimidine glycosylase/DNA-(apurinic or apyrimidinic site) lyase [Corynebacterium bovis]|uniref:bifunctional DNA-formamidopyrimidine glycosylase/DNA-(apurinic or apyrimidinic site) lyase n=1 Tax=Corynebacterium bovis TaxID=36808 RepID=UPI002447E8E0|nr:bifunctional DNA-formamidopyrimidine glycosylase/DNA-(apurinic or apyrimidinic site) lyase [Corynebacterium bovis]MDH2455205.1 bifunctional DNA-formamidopyrimidine glycosylase/DNA-(apurinic or apyrimidinic site) lyase [Corynebacterium bovis]